MARVPDDFSPTTAERLRSELDFMYELCQIVASTSELQPILDWIVHKTTAMFEADEGSIRLLTEEDMATPVGRTKNRWVQPGIHSGSWPRIVSENVMGFLMAKNKPLASADLLDDPGFPLLRSAETRIRSILAVPLRSGNRFAGLLAVTSDKPGRKWTEDEIQLLTIVGSNSASVIEQARLKIEERERQQLENDLRTAKGIQQSMLPSRPLHIGPWQAVGRVVAAHQIGGDAFDYFPVGDGRVALVIGDVSGKGVPAALLMANVQGSVRAHCDGRTPIPMAVASVNDEVLRKASGKFVTMFVAELDASRKLLRYTNAGHNYPMLRRADGTIEDLVMGGFPLGLFEGASYAQGECAFAPGDSLLLYSDGIIDQENLRVEDYGEPALRALWQAEGAHPPLDAIERLFAAVDAHRGRALQNDDMTLLVVGAPATHRAVS